MKKVIAATLGIVLATGAVSALAGKQDREQLAQCKIDIDAHYGDATRMRLRSIKRGEGETHLRLMVTPAEGGNRVVICSVAGDGASRLTDADGVALAEPETSEGLTLAR